MATHQLAQGLASLGRHGDSMLMHVSPSEVEGLKVIGAATGRHITTNPDTGMPEAFSFRDFFTSLIPTGIGMLLGGPAGAAMGLKGGMATAAPVLGGMAAGAAVAGAKGEDPLLGGIMGGLGGYGGGNLAKTFGNMATQGGYQAGQLVGPQLTAEGGLSSAGSGQGMATTLAAQAPASTYGGGLSQIGQGIKELASDPLGAGYKSFTDAGGSGMQLATSFGIPALQAAQPKPVDMTDEEARRKAEENKYRDPRTGLLNLTQARPDFGTMLMATGGTVGSNQSTISTGGIQDLYGTNDQTTGTQQLSKDGYGIGRLNELAAQGSRAKAADTFYAMGGPISFAEGGQNYLDGQGDGMSDSIPATIEGKQPARLADGEFVIPADVVSHLGNGSSKAGAKKLYSMLHKVRKARTGNPKQGKEINPNKYMPA